jgi:aerobic-type carbon monoxide dehydrogenase small subunit (CoxS/CutS family)
MSANGSFTSMISLTINGELIEAEVEQRFSLADFLRHNLGLTGTHLGCEHGVCGACTVIVNGEAVRGCLMLAIQADGAEVATVESLASQDGTLNDLQQAFMEHHALQCGFCTPGILMTLTAYFSDVPEANEVEVREILSGNICRCTGYNAIVRAALDVLAKRKNVPGP